MDAAPPRKSSDPLFQTFYSILIISFYVIVHYVNVEDVARLHAIALLDPEVQSDRLFACAHPIQWTDIIRLLRKYRPDNEKIPDPPENEGYDLKVVPPSKRAEGLLKEWFGQPGWVSLEQSIKDVLDTYST